MCTTLEGPRDAGNHEKRRADISDSKTRVVDPRHALVYYRREYCALSNEICRLACRCLEGGPLRPYGRVCWSGGLHACQRRKPHQSPSKLVSQRAPSQQPVKPTNQPAQPLQHIPQTQPLRAQCSSRGIILYQNPAPESTPESGAQGTPEIGLRDRKRYSADQHNLARSK